MTAELSWEQGRASERLTVGLEAAGFGLIGMHERAALLDGTFEVESELGHGTTITATFPAQHRSERAA